MIYLVRHGSHSLLDRVLCGRLEDVSLSAEGVDQARALAWRFAAMPIDVVQSSPRRRSRETAKPIAERHALAVECANDMDELDAGEWSGLTVEALACDPAWHEWNVRRGSTRPPRGESMQEVQTRAVAHVERTMRQGATAVIVTHAEPIRAVLLHYRKMPLERYSEIEVPPASITSLRASRAGVDTHLADVPGLS
jgi:broad specificity phosphatase PhoE